MEGFDMFDRISALFGKCGLGEICGEIASVSGGLMHKMYKVCSTSGTYAVKCLNEEIMKRPDVFENYAVAEKLEKILEERGIPIVPALSFDGKKMIECGGRYFYIFRWQEGSVTDARAVTREQCEKAGEILGRIHGIQSHNVEPCEPEKSEIDFHAYLSSAQERNSCIADVLSESMDLLSEAQEKRNEARMRLPSMLAIDDPDMDPKNIMWHNGEPYVIDLECLSRSNPIATCIDLALQWAGTANGEYKEENLDAFLSGYLRAYDNGFRSYDELFGIAYAWVDWLEYNLRRAMGMEGSDEAEIRLGEEEVRNTIGRIRYLRSIENDVRKTLGNLPPPDPKKYKTHDDSLCYIDLGFEGELTDLPEYALPEGYRLVHYRDGDKKDWIEIELSSEEVLSREHGEASWARYYGEREKELPERMFFIEDASGEKVATATAFYDIHKEPDPEEGQLHWVAVKKTAQGKGLSKPLITYVLRVMKDLGYRRVKIHTQTNTWLACKIYYDLGFRPEKESLRKDRFGWKMVALLTGREMLP